MKPVAIVETSDSSNQWQSYAYQIKSTRNLAYQHYNCTTSSTEAAQLYLQQLLLKYRQVGLVKTGLCSMWLTHHLPWASSHLWRWTRALALSSWCVGSALYRAMESTALLGQWGAAGLERRRDCPGQEWTVPSEGSAGLQQRSGQRPKLEFSSACWASETSGLLCLRLL